MKSIIHAVGTQYIIDTDLTNNAKMLKRGPDMVDADAGRQFAPNHVKRMVPMNRKRLKK
jgi:hypothetical protein